MESNGADMQCDVTVSEIFQAYFDCRKNKRNTMNALAFEQRLERNLMDLYHELHDGSYQPGRSICFVVTYPKIREVWAADFRDRVVHHLLYNRISRRFYNRFIHDSYACIPGKGVLMAVDRLEKMMRSASRNYSRPAFFMKADIQNFFVSIDKGILESLLAKLVHEPWWMNLCKTIVHHDPTQNAEVRSPAHLIRTVPAHKSLFNSRGNGLPIGNLSSQFFANVYLDPVDQYAKHCLKAQKYIRYVDDIVVIGNDGSELFQMYQDIDSFISSNLRLTLHPRKLEINSVERGINYLGYICKPFSRYLRRSTLDNAAKRVLNTSSPQNLMATANSYFGLMRHANAWAVRKDFARSLRKMGCRTDVRLTKVTGVKHEISALHVC